jgi:predicted ATPase with chaperone activity
MCANVLRYQKRISGPLLDRIDTRSAYKSRAWIMKNYPAIGWVNHQPKFRNAWNARANVSANASPGRIGK